MSAERGALLDARNGKPKGVFKDADEALARARSARDDALRAKAQLDADVDRLAALRQEHGQAQQAEPWKALEARAAEARTRLAALARERETLEGLRRELAQAASNLGLLQDQVGRDQQDEAELRTLEQQAQAAAERLRQSEAPLARALQQRDAQRAAADAARLALTAAQAQADRRDLEQQLRQLDADTERLDGALKAADELIAQGSALKAEVVGIEVPDADLQGLRGIESQRASLRAQLQAVATRLSYRLEPGARALLDGRELEVDGQLLLTAAAELELPGVGRLRIEPGGKDLPALQRELAALDAEGAALLARLGAASVDEVEARHARHAALKGDLEGMRRALQIHAPKGIDMLRGQRDEALARRDALRARLHCRRPPPARPWTSPRRGRPWARRRLPPNTRAMPGPRPGARRTRRQPAPRCCNRRPRPAGPRCCRPSASRSGRSGQGGWPRRAAIMICWRGGWARPRRRWTASARR